MRSLLRGAIVRHYVACALWSTPYCGDMPDDEDTPENCDDIAGPDDCESAMLATMREQCAAFLWEARAMLRPFMRRDGLERTLERAGHDLWLTAQGHGAGFWDGDWNPHGDALSDLARTHGEHGYLYVAGDYAECSVSLS